MKNKIKQFFKNIWEKICQFGRWIKTHIKHLLVGTAIAATITIPVVIDQTKNEISLDKITQKYEQATEIKTKYQQDGVSLKRTVKNDPRDRIEVTVGNKDETDFSPQLKIARWDDEVNLVIKPKALEGVARKDKDLTFVGDKIKFSTPKIDYELYELTEGEGGYEFEVILKEKPLTNKIEFTLQDKDVDYFYQPPLTQQEIDEGVVRPENVVGSYAVYAKTPKTNWTGGKKYKVGKVGHIYRPKIIDSAGTEVWGVLNIDKGILSVTVPQEFLDKAIYPIMVDPTFGYLTEGGTEAASSYVVGCKFTAPTESGNITKISTFVRQQLGKTPYVLSNAIYSDSSGNPNARLAVDSADGNILVSDTWIDVSLSYNFTASTVYWLSYWTNQANFYHYDTGATNQRMYDNTANIYENWPATIALPVYSARIVSIYATYTAAGGAVPTSQVIIVE